MITFDFNSRKKKKSEEFPNFPVLIQYPYLGDKKEVAKFKMNRATLDLLEYPGDLRGCRVSIARETFDDNVALVLVNTTGMETPHQYNVNKDGTFNCQFLSQKLKKYYEINPATEITYTVVGYFNEEETSYNAGIITICDDDKASKPEVLQEEISAEDAIIKEYDDLYQSEEVEESLI